MSSASPLKRGRGRPRVDAEAVNVRLERALLDAIDVEVATRPEPRPARPAIVREIVAAWVASRGAR